MRGRSRVTRWSTISSRQGHHLYQALNINMGESGIDTEVVPDAEEHAAPDTRFHRRETVTAVEQNDLAALAVRVAPRACGIGT